MLPHFFVTPPSHSQLARAIVVAILLFLGFDAAAQAVNYDIVYLRAPRKADPALSDWPEVINPTKMEPGTDLMLLRSDGSEEVLFPAGAKGAVLDPVVSFDAQHVHFAYFPDVTQDGRNYQRDGAPKLGSDIYRIHLKTRAVKRLTQQTFTPPYAGVKWSPNLLTGANDETYLGYGIFNMAPCPLPGGKIMFVSNRDGYLPNKTYTFPNLRLHVMDDNGDNIEQIGHLNIGSAMHPIVLKDGRVVFSSYETQGLRDQRVWSLWSILPDGRYWEPMFGSFKVGSSMHFQTQLSDGRVAVIEYYNLNNEGFGTLLAFDPKEPANAPRFGSFNALDVSNPKIQRGIWYFQPGHPEHLKPRYTQYRFSPPNLATITAFSHGEDNASSPLPGATASDQWAGKVTHPAAAPNNDVLVSWSSGPVNNLNRPTTQPRVHAGIYLIKNSATIDDPRNMVKIRHTPNYNLQMPKAVVPYKAIHGVDEPARIEWLPNTGTVHATLPEGTPFGLIGTSTFYRRDSKPGNFEYISFPQDYNGWDRFNTGENDDNPNWFNQGSDAGKYSNSDIYAVRIVGMEATVHRSYGATTGNAFNAHQGRERLRILGEIPLKKSDVNGNTILDPDGNPDTSFLAKIPADTPFTFHTIDKNGMLLNASQTWHQVRPGEVRNDCGGCHAHAQRTLSFAQTAAGKPGYAPVDLTRQQMPVLSITPEGQTLIKYLNQRALDVEFHRDIKPVLKAKCASCHTGASPPAGLNLNDDSVVNGFDNTYNRLANDESAIYGIKSVLAGGQWRGSNASRYVRKFQSRRSLLIWKIFGQRLDGWSNADHPTESAPGDAATLPVGSDRNAADIDFSDTLAPSHASRLTSDEKLLFARWIDLGAPVDSSDANLKQFGWFNDEQKPVLTITSPPNFSTSFKDLNQISFAAFDSYSGLNRASLSVKANFPIDGQPPGTELIGRFAENDHVWRYQFPPVNARIARPTITVSAKDIRGNESRIERVASSAACDLDVNGDALTDAIDAQTVIGWMLGYRGDALLQLAGNTTLTADQITQRINALNSVLDLDGDNQIRANTDGLMLLRVAQRRANDAVTPFAINPAGQRPDATSILLYLSNACGVPLP
jgi:Hydrazine synthase alpha subunit middle domain